VLREFNTLADKLAVKGLNSYRIDLKEIADIAETQKDKLWFKADFVDYLHNFVNYKAFVDEDSYYALLSISWSFILKH